MLLTPPQIIYTSSSKIIAMTADGLGRTYAQLCEKCSVLSVDQNTIQSGRKRIVAGRRLDNMETVRLPYDQDDTLPELPLLAISARAGCSFRAELRRATLSKCSHLSFSGPIWYDLRYWINRSEFRASGRFEIVWMQVTVHRADDHTSSSEPIYFSIDYEGRRLVLRTSDFALKLAENALCDDSIIALKRTLSECDMSCRCRLSSSPRFVPSRLLDIGLDHRYNIRLLDFSETS